MAHEIKNIIEGSFGDKVVPVHIFLAEKTDNVLINIHGSYGSMYSSSEKYLNLAKQLSSQNLANVVLYQSSRVNSESKAKSFEDKINNFTGKDYEHELQDLKIVIEYIKNDKSLPNNFKNANLILNGNSLGGMLSFSVSQFYEINLINTVGTGLLTHRSELPALKLCVAKSELEQTLNSYTGAFIMQYGTYDAIFKAANFASLYQSVTHAKEKNFLNYDGVDHQFENLYYNESAKPYNAVIDVLSRAISGKEIETGTIFLKDKNYYNALEKETNKELEKFHNTLQGSDKSKYIADSSMDDVGLTLP